MACIKDTVQYIRSKNAGPFWLTIDFFCSNEEKYQELVASPNFNKETIAAADHICPENIKLYYLPKLRVVKISFPRIQIQGSPFDTDMHGGQQYIPLLDLNL